jgi:hypothetical protein
MKDLKHPIFYHWINNREYCALESYCVVCFVIGIAFTKSIELIGSLL